MLKENEIKVGLKFKHKIDNRTKEVTKIENGYVYTTSLAGEKTVMPIDFYANSHYFEVK